MKKTHLYGTLAFSGLVVILLVVVVTQMRGGTLRGAVPDGPGGSVDNTATEDSPQPPSSKGACCYKGDKNKSVNGNIVIPGQCAKDAEQSACEAGIGNEFVGGSCLPNPCCGMEVTKDDDTVSKQVVGIGYAQPPGDGITPAKVKASQNAQTNAAELALEVDCGQLAEEKGKWPTCPSTCPTPGQTAIGPLPGNCPMGNEAKWKAEFDPPGDDPEDFDPSKGSWVSESKCTVKCRLIQTCASANEPVAEE